MASAGTGVRLRNRRSHPYDLPKKGAIAHFLVSPLDLRQRRRPRNEVRDEAPAAAAAVCEPVGRRTTTTPRRRNARPRRRRGAAVAVLLCICVPGLVLHLRRAAEAPPPPPRNLAGVPPSPRAIPTAYRPPPTKTPTVAGGGRCALTAVIADPRLPALPPEDPAYASALESVAEFVGGAPDGDGGACLIIQTSGCVATRVLRAEAARESGVPVPPSDGRWIPEDAASELIFARAGTHLRRWIASGRVRLSLLDRVAAPRHGRGLDACDRFDPNSLWTSDAYYETEFVDGGDGGLADADLLLFFQRDGFLCRPFDAGRWGVYAYVGGPWTVDFPSAGIASARDFWRVSRGGRGLRGDEGLRARGGGDASGTAGGYDADAWGRWWRDGGDKGGGPLPAFPRDYPIRDARGEPSSGLILGLSGNGGLSLRSRKWMVRALRTCPYGPAVQTSPRSGMITACPNENTQLPEDVYFSTVLAAIGAPLPTPFEAQMLFQEVPWSDRLVPETEGEVNATVTRLFGPGEVERYWERRQSTSSHYDEKTPIAAEAVGYHKCWSKGNCPTRQQCKYAVYENSFGVGAILWLWKNLVHWWLRAEHFICSKWSRDISTCGLGNPPFTYNWFATNTVVAIVVMGSGFAITMGVMCSRRGIDRAR